MRRQDLLATHAYLPCIPVAPFFLDEREPVGPHAGDVVDITLVYIQLFELVQTKWFTRGSSSSGQTIRQVVGMRLGEERIPRMKCSV